MFYKDIQPVKPKSKKGSLPASEGAAHSLIGKVNAAILNNRNPCDGHQSDEGFGW